MSKSSIAIMSDIHGNSNALRAVLEDISGKGIGKIVNLGDCLYGPLEPAETAELLMSNDIFSIAGNQDTMLINPTEEVKESPSYLFTKKCLEEKHLEWVRNLPKTAVFEDTFFLCHGTPDSDSTYLLWKITESGLSLRPDREIMPELREVEQKIVLCGHDHVSRTLFLPDGKLIINPGSVGLPAYTDELPLPHAMESGTPHARYCVLEKQGTNWRFEQIAVPYDWEQAAHQALQNGRPDWAESLCTGRASIRE